MLPPLTFKPILKERIWGGDQLQRLYGKPVSTTAPIGESWEITDRPEGVSEVAGGPLAGRTLRWLMEHQRAELLGAAQSANGLFPLLLKILDAREKLSLQVHPPASLSASLGGEPKTEMWYVAQALPGAELYVGLRRGVTRAEFERRIADGSVAECFHRIAVKAGDVMFLPSGRVHALGAGLVIFEIQQNSDTTYRVFDWNRVGLDGRPRELHVEQSLKCIDFEDFEPRLNKVEFIQQRNHRVAELTLNSLFTVQAVGTDGAVAALPYRREGVMQIVAVTQGRLAIRHPDSEVVLGPGGFCLVPAATREARLEALEAVDFLLIEATC